MAKKKIVKEELLEELENLVEEIQSAEVEQVKEEAKAIEKEYTKQQTIEEMLLEYIDKQEGKSFSINSFFTSLYTLPEALATSKMIKEILVKAANEKKIKVVNNRHFDLGMTHYDANGKANKYNISNIEIFIEK